MKKIKIKVDRMPLPDPVHRQKNLARRADKTHRGLIGFMKFITGFDKPKKINP